MATLLLTNDDGIDSPALVPLARALTRLGTVRVIVPDCERSWIAKAISRFEPLRVRRVERDGLAIDTVSGSPADCVNLAVHTLHRERPALVVSGVNLGLNYGTAFLWSSGTVGAAIEASIAGLPAVAFSMAVPADAYGLSGAHRAELLGSRVEAMAEIAAEVVADLLGREFPPGIDCFSVNMPAEATVKSARVVTQVTRCRYGRLFVPGPEGDYLHRFSSLEDIRPGGDIAAVQSGAVAISPLCLDPSIALPDGWRARLER
ncbi:MAG: 5'/3'-nucleotidase SurE [Deltaproteobacteria bacterium]|nr:5'/3'-nucleotidase SurE [Deltaproteobacteria bacterium]